MYRHVDCVAHSMPPATCRPRLAQGTQAHSCAGDRTHHSSRVYTRTRGTLDSGLPLVDLPFSDALDTTPVAMCCCRFLTASRRAVRRLVPSHHHIGAYPPPCLEPPFLSISFYNPLKKITKRTLLACRFKKVGYSYQGEHSRCARPPRPHLACLVEAWFSFCARRVPSVYIHMYTVVGMT